ncbi:MAG: hypothetical protein EBV32_04520 [Proteobacteria bacterium]|uniref:Uncharacterized protein n=1 Tax=Candidatus Fonsibacter lacus TaxID=2576439 RepID=A0A964XS29_9PROT|nr:hypothetical protein [Candidatus Fonsibacter lacus]NCU72602.1 hypothetical protein [Candidatus Fonsibacter lacus]
MADTKISALASGAPAQGTDETVIARSGSNYKLTVAQITGYLGTPITVANGGTGAATLTGYVKGNGTSAMTASATVPGSDVSGNITGNAANVTGTVAVANGGTGQTTYTDGQLLIGNSTGNTLAKSTLTAGSGISITNGSGTITIAATGGGGSGTVTSVGGTGTVNGITLTGTVTTSGNLTLGGALTGVDLTTQVTGTLPVGNGGTGITTGTSGGVPYFSGSTTIASSAVLAANALVIGGGAGVAPSTTTTGTGVIVALGTNVGTAGALVVNGGVLGTPSSGTLTSCTGLPLSTGVTGTLPVANGGTGITSFGTGVATWLGTPSSANLAAAVTDETGSGSLVFATSPTLVTPVLGTPTSGNLNSCTADGTNKVGYRNIPAVGTKTSSYTLAVGDVGKYVQVSTGGSIVIPDATFAEGDVVSIFNNTTGNVTLTCSITTAYIAGTDSDKATMTLATRGVATVLFISSTVCVVSGNVS